MNMITSFHWRSVALVIKKNGKKGNVFLHNFIGGIFNITALYFIHEAQCNIHQHRTQMFTCTDCTQYRNLLDCAFIGLCCHFLCSFNFNQRQLIQPF